MNEVVQKVSGADQPVPIWTDDGMSVVTKDTSRHMLYSLIFRLKVRLVFQFAIKLALNS